MSTESNKRKLKNHFKDEWLQQKDYKDCTKKILEDE